MPPFSSITVCVHSQTTSLRWLTFLLGPLTVTLTILPPLLDLFFSSDSSICSTVASLPLENSQKNHVVVSVSIRFLSNTKGNTNFHCTAYGCSRANKDGFRKDLGDVPWEDFVKLSASAAATELREWVRVRINVYISHCKYQVIPIHPYGFQLLLLLPQLIEITTFVCTNRINLQHLNGNSDRLVIVAKGFLKLSNLLIK